MPVPTRSSMAAMLTGVALALVGLPGVPVAPAAAAGDASPWTAMGAPPPVVRLASGRAVPESQRRAMRALRSSVSPSDPVTATFQTTYVGAWDSQQKAAFQQAVDVWSRLLVSSIPIVVRAELAVLDPGVLGSAGPANALYNTSTDSFYAVALANALAGEDLDPPGTSSTDPYDADVDIDATFADDDALIYYGTDGNVPAGKYDFTSTVMHELGHGLGFLGALRVRGDQGGYGSCDPSFDAPFIYDRFTVHISGSTTTRLLDYACGSTAMGTALRSGSVFWDGPRGISASGGTRPELFAPSTWQQGSSYSHLDEAVYPSGTLNSLMTPVGDAQEVNAGPGPIALGILADQGWQLSAAAEPPVATRYTPLAPARVLDTRTGVGTALARVGAGGTRDLQVTGVNGVPADATAVVLNVTGVGPSAATDIRVYPTPGAPSAAPTVSNLNLARGLTRANLVTVKVGAGGKVRLRNNSGTVDLLADLAGFYSPGASSTYFPVSPTRVLDTRPATSAGVAPGKVAAGDVRDLQVAGVAGVPTSATAVVLGVTAANATATTDVRVFPLAGSASPEISNINAYRGGPTPNLVIVALGTDGKVRLRNNSGEVDLLADVYGYYDPSSAGSLFRALTPDRVLDTRRNTVSKLSGPGSLDLVVSGAGGVGAGATAVVLNVTGTGPTRSTDVRVFPAPASGSAVPTVSTLNLVTGQTAADAATVPVGSGSRIRFYNNSGAVALIADVAGWFGPA